MAKVAIRGAVGCMILGFILSWPATAQAAAVVEVSASPPSILVPVGGSDTSNLTVTRADDPRTQEEAEGQGGPTYQWIVSNANGADPHGLAFDGVNPTATLTAGRTTPGTSDVLVEVTVHWPCAGGPEITTTGTATIAVLAEGVQYYEPDNGYVDVTGTLYIMEGTTVSFQAVPADAGNPVWGGTAGASGTGLCKDVTFTTCGDFTVTATRSTTVTVTAKVYQITGRHVASDYFDGRATDKYGVREEVKLSFTVQPPGLTAAQIGVLRWTEVAGGGVMEDGGWDGNGLYLGPETAPTMGKDVTLRLTVLSGPSKGKAVDIGFKVIPPLDVAFELHSNIWHIQNHASVGFKASLHLLPKDVSFWHISYGEDACDTSAATLTGWFNQQYPNGCAHPANGPVHVLQGNINTGSKVDGDDNPFFDYVSPPSPAFAAGTLTWIIPQRYYTGQWITIEEASKTHKGEIDATGKATITKAGVGPCSRPFNAPSSNY